MPKRTATTADAPRAVMDVRKLSSLEEVERRLERLTELPPDADLLLPNGLSGRYLGGQGAALQLIISWRRRCPEGRLRIHVNEDAGSEEEQATLANFLDSDHGLLAAALAGELRARRGVRRLEGGWGEALRERMGKMDEAEDLLHGRKGFALCLDDSRFEAPRALYRARPPQAHESPQLLGRSGFDRLAAAIAARLWPRGPGVDGVGLASLLHELFRNTHDWARRDEREVRYGAGCSVRGIRIERHSFPLAEQEAMAAGQPALVEYLGRPGLESTDDRRRLVELTIFDSGPGIAARRVLALAGEGEKGSDLEGRALIDCLKKHISSSPDSLGIGLHRAMRALSDTGAFLMVRSGRLSLHRDFLATPYRPDTDKGEPFLLDWMAGIGGATARAPVAGAQITALIPLRERHVQTAL
jgi:hypothetical protein